MTTPTLREAADFLDGTVDPTKEQWEAVHMLAANTLRALSDAQSDAGKAAMDYFDSLNWHRAPDEYETAIYLAGHAQGYAAGLAASSAKCAELDRGQPMTLRNVPFGSIIETGDGIRACVSEYVYTNDVDSQRQCILLASGEYAHFDNGNDEIVRVIDLTALATTKADALTLANEVRRLERWLVTRIVLCDSKNESSAEFVVRANRPAAVTAAMERYTDAGNERSGE